MPNLSPSRRTGAEFGLVAVVVIWGFNFAITKNAFELLSPFAFNAARLTLSVLVAGGLAWRACRGSTESLWPGRELVALILLGVLGHGLYQLLFVSGLARTTSGNAALMLASAPVWTAVVEAFTRQARVPPLAWFGLAVALAGTAVLTYLGATVQFGVDTLAGDVLVAASAVAWGAYTARGRPLVAIRSPTVVLFWSLLFALPILWIAGAHDLYVGRSAFREPSLWFALFWSGALSTGIAYALWNRGIRELGASATSAWNHLVPVVAVVVGALWLGEPVGPPQIAGGSLVVIGVVMTRQALR
ncbi:MAG: DMT family transporter [Planctomycetota bacterium]